jgi:hypothetical protein
MDGGRILRAVLARRMGFLPATRTAISVARWFALALGAYGVLAGHLLLVPLAIALWLMGFVELAAAHVRGYAGDRPDPWQTAWMPQAGPGFDGSPSFERQPDFDAGSRHAPAGEVQYIPPGGPPPSDSGPGSGRGNSSFKVVLRRL